MKTNTLKTNLGQSLFEVIVAVGLVGLILVGIVSLSTVTVRNASFSRNNVLATKYAQEATEWLRSERDSDWTAFASRVGGTKCISSPPSWGGSGLCSIGDNFRRGVTLTLADPDQINAVIEVEWTDGTGVHEVKSITTFTRWR